MKEERVGKSFTSLILDIFFFVKTRAKIHTRDARWCDVAAFITSTLYGVPKVVVVP